MDQGGEHGSMVTLGGGERKEKERWDYVNIVIGAITAMTDEFCRRAKEKVVPGNILRLEREREIKKSPFTMLSLVFTGPVLDQWTQNGCHHHHHLPPLNDDDDAQDVELLQSVKTLVCVIN